MAGGRPTHFSDKKKDKIFSDYLQFFRENKKVPPKTHKMWLEIKQRYELPKSVSTGAIYTAMLRIFNDILVGENTKVESNQLNVSNESNTSKASNENEDVEKSGIHFKLNISTSVWNRISPTNTIYGRTLDNEHQKDTRTYNVLPSGVWTYTLSHAISKQRKDIPCRWCFKRGKVYTSQFAANYITVDGNCTTCSAKLNGRMENQPGSPDKVIKFTFDVSKINYSMHNERKLQKNVKIGGKQAEILFGTAEAQGQATSVRRKMLAGAVELFEAPVERIPTSNAIRCSQYRQRKSERVDDCPLKALELLKLSFYNNWIRSIGYDPLSVIYVSTDTQVLYKVYKRKNKKTRISCDATGSIVKKLGKYSILLFLLCIALELNLLNNY